MAWGECFEATGLIKTDSSSFFSQVKRLNQWQKNIA
jgi:hypothetical protein